MKIQSHPLIFKDFETSWYKKWALELKQDKDHLDGHMIKANKFWQNAIICQVLFERGKLRNGSAGLGFGVGRERLPAVFAKQGANVTATDQDFRQKKAAHWAQRELATDLESLNRFKIADPDDFISRVRFRAADMKKIPPDLNYKYDFIWSNCALGHLGSIKAGLEFIEESLKCLKPGGVAVHTTEINVLSNEKTVENGDTVIFRLQDLHDLFTKLTREGYQCSPLRFALGRSQDDFRIDMQPKFGNDYSKIQVGGHIATQAVIIIRRPKRVKARQFVKPLSLLRLNRAFSKNLQEIQEYSAVNDQVKQLLDSQAATPDQIKITPLKKRLKVTAPINQTKDLHVEYKNESPVNLYSLHGHLYDTPPTVLATYRPRNRSSLFVDSSWVAESKNRPSSDFVLKDSQGKYRQVDRILPGQSFAFRTRLKASVSKKGQYIENFMVVQEGQNWVEGSEVTVEINVS
jgi:SAM-dependent methyltransferase